MMTALLALLLTAAPDDKETLTQALSKVAGLESYSFKGESEFQSPFGNAPAQVPSMDGKYQKESGLYIKTDRGEMFRKGDRTFFKQGDADWQDLNNFTPTAPADPNNKNRGRGLMLGKMLARTFKAPHDELKDLAKGFKEVRKAEKTDKIGEVECTQYSGDLSEEAMKNAPLGRMLSQFGGANPEVKGSAKVWVDASGNVVIYEVVTKATVEIQGNQVELSMTRRSELSAAGKTKVEIPAGVQKLLSEKPKTEEKKE